MNTELFISRKTLSKDSFNYSRPIIRIAILSIILGISVMILSVAIVTGFQQEIRDKVVGFGSHLRITRFDSNKSYEREPVSTKQNFYPQLNLENIRHIQVFAMKAGIIKTNNQIQGVAIKGVGTDYDWSFFDNKIKKGNIPKFPKNEASNEVLISKTLSKLLKISVGDDIRMYFIIGNHQRGRKFNVSGIYETGLADFDQKFVIGDIRHIQKLNGWEENQVGGFEILINDFDKITETGNALYDEIPYDLNIQTIENLHPEIFDWLELQDMNVIIILLIMVLVASITMISTLLILILERTNMIGILKALGMKNRSIRKIFLYNATFIVIRGLVIGNVVALLLAFIQDYFGIISLPQESYFVNVVPVNLQIIDLLWINAGTLVVSYLMMIIPSMVITRISPVKAIRFE